MAKRVNVVIVRVQSTELEVNDDFEITPESVSWLLGSAADYLDDRIPNDTETSSMHVELIEEEP